MSFSIFLARGLSRLNCAACSFFELKKMIEREVKITLRLVERLPPLIGQDIETEDSSQIETSHHGHACYFISNGMVKWRNQTKFTACKMIFTSIQPYCSRTQFCILENQPIHPNSVDLHRYSAMSGRKTVAYEEREMQSLLLQIDFPEKRIVSEDNESSLTWATNNC